MTPSVANPRLGMVIRWIARGWTILATLVILWIVVVPDPYAVKTPVGDWVALGILYGTALLGLWLAWRWEGLGGAIAMASLPVYFVAARIIRGVWPPILGSLAIRGSLFVLPGFLFVVCWFLSRRNRRR